MRSSRRRRAGGSVMDVKDPRHTSVKGATTRPKAKLGDISMRATFLFTSMLFLLASVSPSARSGPGSTRFTSAYTTLTKCGSGMAKKEEREAEKNGSDIPTRCKGYGGYDVYIYYSACSSIFTLDKGDESISLGMQAVNWK